MMNTPKGYDGPMVVVDHTDTERIIAWMMEKFYTADGMWHAAFSVTIHKGGLRRALYEAMCKDKSKCDGDHGGTACDDPHCWHR